MFERGITERDVISVLRDGDVIADYPEDEPFPSRLMLGHIAGRPLHVVLARDDESETCYVVTAYQPDPELWDEGYRTRRRR